MGWGVAPMPLDPQKSGWKSVDMSSIFDFVVVGGGILGVSTAWQLQKQFPDCSVALVEKEDKLARHQTGHNSGVIHAGVYYKPDSLKAKFCYQGNEATKRFCDEHDVTYNECGKLLVATNGAELTRMMALQQRAQQNGLETQLLDQVQLKALEPHITGVGAVLVPSTGIVSFTQVVEAMAKVIEAKGGVIKLGASVLGLDERKDEVIVKTEHEEIECRYLVTCGGLMADRMVRLLGLKPDFQIIPFRGDYYQLRPEHNKIIKHLIYPIPNPALPFLGVHLTRMIDGSVTVGPNAVLAFKREGYNKFDFDLKDSVESILYPGFYKLMLKHLKPTLKEFKNGFSKRHYLAEVQKYCPDLTLDDLQPYPAGVRAQAVSNKGEMIDDFLFMNTPRTVNVCNAPSPAATSAIPIGQHIVDQVVQRVPLT